MLFSDVLSVVAAALSGINTLALMGIGFKTGQWVGEQRTRTEHLERELALQRDRFHELSNSVQRLIGAHEGEE